MQATISNIDNDKIIISIFEKSYELLPTPIRIIVNKEWCIKYLMSRKEVLFEKIKELQRRPSSGQGDS